MTALAHAMNPLLAGAMRPCTIFRSPQQRGVTANGFVGSNLCIAFAGMSAPLFNSGTTSVTFS